MGGRRGFHPISPISELVLTFEVKSSYTEFQVDSFKTTAVIVQTDRQTDGQTDRRTLPNRLRM